MAKSRCSHEDCKKKLDASQKIIGMCRCGGCFCSKHRLDHNCQHDYKAEINAKQFIGENKCVPKKLEDI